VINAAVAETDGSRQKEKESETKSLLCVELKRQAKLPVEM
jgi:hypothetical protein